jgi:excisionase family DNA binding protein
MLLTVREAACLLACSPQTVRRRIAHGDLRAYRHGRIVRLEREEVLRFIAAHREIRAQTLALGRGPRYRAGTRWWAE